MPAAEPPGVLVDRLGTWVTRLVDDSGAWRDRDRAEAVLARARRTQEGDPPRRLT